MHSIVLWGDSAQNRRTAFALAVALVALFGGVAGCRASESTEVPEAPNSVYLKQAGIEWDTLFNARQGAQLAALYAEDAVSMPFNRPNLIGRQALQADFEKFFGDNEQVRHETFVDEVLVTAEWGIERARYTLAYTPKEGGKTVVETGRHVVCRKLIDGRWQIVWEIFNTDQSAG